MPCIPRCSRRKWRARWWHGKLSCRSPQYSKVRLHSSLSLLHPTSYSPTSDTRPCTRRGCPRTPQTRLRNELLRAHTSTAVQPRLPPRRPAVARLHHRHHCRLLAAEASSAPLTESLPRRMAARLRCRLQPRDEHPGRPVLSLAAALHEAPPTVRLVRSDRPAYGRRLGGTPARAPHEPREPAARGCRRGAFLGPRGGARAAGRRAARRLWGTHCSLKATLNGRLTRRKQRNNKRNKQQRTNQCIAGAASPRNVHECSSASSFSLSLFLFPLCSNLSSFSLARSAGALYHSLSTLPPNIFHTRKRSVE